MIETLMKQLYFRGLRRRVEHLVAQRRGHFNRLLTQMCRPV